MAVYTEIDDDALAALLAEYDIGAAQACKGIAEGVENSNYLLATERGQFILTLYEKRVHEEHLPYFLGLMDHLSAKGLNCPVPVKARDGDMLHRVAGRPAAIITFLNGVSPKRPSAPQCGEVGAALARLHMAGGDFPLYRENALSVAGWRRLFDACRDRADEVRPGLAASLASEIDMMEASWPRLGDSRSLPAGVIHADLFPDNVFFLGDRLSGLIDFYFACNDYLAYDLAVCLNAWCFEPDLSLNATKARLMISAYRRERPLRAAEIAALPVLARGAALRFLLTRLYDWLNQVDGALVKPKDPLEYVRKLRFHRGVRDAGSYGID
jgi:homoserine kinase type II